MLGPEQVNLSVKPTPVFMEGAPALKLSSVLARELGLADNQIIKAVVVASKSGFFFDTSRFKPAPTTPEPFR